MPSPVESIQAAAIQCQDDPTDENFENLLRFLRDFIWCECKKWRIPHETQDDLVNQARLACWKSLPYWDRTRVTFYNYLRVAIRNTMHSMLKHGQAISQEPPGVLSLDWVGSYRHSFLDGGGDHFSDGPNELNKLVQYASPGPSAEDVAMRREAYRLNMDRLQKLLTPRERSVLLLYIQDYSYEQIRDALDIGTKAVDNSLARIRRKAQKVLGGWADAEPVSGSGDSPYNDAVRMDRSGRYSYWKYQELGRQESSRRQEAAWRQHNIRRERQGIDPHELDWHQWYEKKRKEREAKTRLDKDGNPPKRFRPDPGREGLERKRREHRRELQRIYDARYAAKRKARKQAGKQQQCHADAENVPCENARSAADSSPRQMGSASTPNAPFE